MKYTTIIGILLIAIAIVATFVGKINFGDILKEPEFVLGILYGSGLGILIGGIIGWLYKKSNKPDTKTPPSGKDNL